MSDEGHPSQVDIEQERIELERYKARLDYKKFVLGSVFVALAIAAIPPSFQLATAALEYVKSNADRQAKQQASHDDYIKDFVSNALNQDIELRIRFAQYFARVSTEPYRQDWVAYLKDLTGVRTDIRMKIDKMEADWRLGQAQQQDNVEIERLERNLAWAYKEVGYVERNRSAAVNPRAPEPVSPRTIPTEGGASSSIPTNWDRPAPTPTTYHGPDGDCGPTGDGGDTKTNFRKNRVDVPSEYHQVTWRDFQNLPYPLASNTLLNWTSDQLAQIEPYQGVAVSIVGHLLAVRVQDRGSGEAANCHFTKAEETNWDMPIVEQAGDSDGASILAVITPRVRKLHAKWTSNVLVPWIKSDAPVRISGWMMLDPAHRSQLGRFSSTLWEIHPVTKIEVFKDEHWVDLDGLP